jgi:hypothetical protein
MLHHGWEGKEREQEGENSKTVAEGVGEYIGEHGWGMRVVGEGSRAVGTFVEDRQHGSIEVVGKHMHWFGKLGMVVRGNIFSVNNFSTR